MPCCTESDTTFDPERKLSPSGEQSAPSVRKVKACFILEEEVCATMNIGLIKNCPARRAGTRMFKVLVLKERFIIKYLGGTRGLSG